ncbi:hypothetical protein GCM10027610_014640 [Dactylosporangium cerinum]
MIALGRTDSKLDVAVDNGAHHGINTRDKSVEAIQDEFAKLTGRRTVDAILDGAGAKASVSLVFDLLGVEAQVSASQVIWSHLCGVRRPVRI